MKPFASAVAAALTCVACQATPPTAPPAQPIELDKPFQLRLGGTAGWAGGALTVGFAAVQADSRCPRGEQCLVAGTASVRIWVQQSNGTRENHDLYTPPHAGQTARIGDLALRLIELTPYPVTGRAILPEAYEIRLSVGRNQPAEATR